MKVVNIISILTVIIMFSGCSSTNVSLKKAYPEFYKNQMATILVMPPINKTNKVEAKEFFFTTLNQPLCERGYYVIPPYLSMAIFKNESAYDADVFIDKPVDKFSTFFNADLILFTVIHRWEKTALTGAITVEVEYIVKSAKTNLVAYTRKGKITVDTSVNSGSGGGLAGMLINMAATAINTAMTPHVKAARACNTITFTDFPAGIYNPKHSNDSTLISGKQIFSAKVKAN